MKWKQKLYQTLGRNISALRKKAGLTQLELSKKVHLSRPAIANIETGRQGVLIHQVPIFAKALKCSERILLKGVWP